MRKCILLPLLVSLLNSRASIGQEQEFIEPHFGNILQRFKSISDQTRSGMTLQDEYYSEPVYLPFSICESPRDFVDITQYSGQFGISRDIAEEKSEATVFIRTKRSSESPLVEPGSNLENISWCTGTLISRARVITAGHCLSKQAISKAKFLSGSNAEFGEAELASILQVVFNYTTESLKVPGAISVSNIDDIEVVQDSYPLDYAIFTVDAAVADKFQPITIMRPEIINGETLSIIQHPGLVPKVIAGGSRTKMSSDRTIGYNISTKRSSSGAGILDSVGRLVGVHNNPGCEGGGENSGMSIEYALKDIE